MSWDAHPTISIPQADESLRLDTRAFLAERLRGMSLAARARSWMGFDASFSRDLAARGLIGLTLPKAYGGGGLSPFARFVVIEELLAAGAPVAAHWIAERQSAPLILKYGTEEQKQHIVPAICRGELYFCAGMSEPGSGSDLASVSSHAERSGDGWRLNGAKIWTTHAKHAHYMVALVRTSGKHGDRSSGLSQLLIDMDTPGVEVRPIRDAAGDDHFAEVRFDNVMLPDDALIGCEGNGWQQVNEELAFERSGPERIHSVTVLIDAWIDHLRQRGSVTREEHKIVGGLCARLAGLRRMSIAVTAKIAGGADVVTEAMLVKDLGTSFEQSVPGIIATHLADDDTACGASGLVEALRYYEAMCPSFSLRGGTREILRGIIARGLGLR